MGTYYAGTCYYDEQCLENSTGDATDNCLYCPEADDETGIGCSMVGGANGVVIVFQVLAIALGGFWIRRRKHKKQNPRN